MRQPELVTWLFVPLMTATGLLCLVRWRLASQLAGEERRLEASSALKGLGMAVMALPVGTGVALPEGLWVAVLVPAGLWSAAAAVRSAGHRRHHLEHAVGHLAMVYMAVSMAGRMANAAGAMPAMPGMAPVVGAAWLTGALLVFFGVCVVVSCTRLFDFAVAPSGARRYRGVGVLWSPQWPEACHLVLGVGMFTMLLAM
ncbi:DUF5134 domain-containing protein [Kitasatospora sp. NPDC052896]|uniref:DUF5134 domain-containing protein n=1 Tax=Kitasatospora sp. NPDC052896 TaxID=3364061 RepID=UPI0037CCBA48